MTEITDLRIRGFKTIEQLDINPSKINLITGRNNTGKTSVLEAINLAFNPHLIEEFALNLDKIVNVESSACTIDAEYYLNQSTIDEYVNSDTPGTHREVSLRQPRDEEALSIFTHAIQDILQINEDYPVRIRRTMEKAGRVMSNQSMDELQDIINNVLEEGLSELPEEILLPEVKNNSIIIQVNRTEYPYIHFGSYYREIRDTLVSNSIQKTIDQSEDLAFEDADEEQKEEIEYFLNRTFENRLAPRFGSGRFIDEKPEQEGGVKLVKSPKLREQDVDMEEENSAIRISDIEDYIKENEIVENLNDFSPNKLVFEEEEKYEIPYSYMGDGFKTVAGILWELFSVERHENVLLLEEPDANLHPGYIEQISTDLVDIVKNNNIQIFMTTHSMDLINSFFSERMKEEHGEFISDELKIIQLTDPVPRSLDYEKAEEEIEDLGIDLRGV